MAVITELFLALAGFATGISQNDEVHPAVAQTFATALKFGSSVRQLREKTSEIPHPVCTVLKQLIVVKYLNELAKLEASIVCLLKNEPGLLQTNSLRYSAIIMGHTADIWQPLFTFGLDALAQLDNSLEDFYLWLRAFVRVNTGSKEMRDLGTECLRELDRYWLSDLRLCILGETKKLNNHPIIEGQLERIEDIRSVISQLQYAAFRDIRVLNLAASLINEVSVTLTPQARSLFDFDNLSSHGNSSSHENLPERGNLTLPLLAEEMDGALQTIQCTISRELSAKLISRDEVSVLIAVLRDVVLFGSSLFEQCFVDAQGDINSALDAYLQCTDPQSLIGLHPEIVRVLLTAPDNKLCIRFSNNDKAYSTRGSMRFLKLILTKKQCTALEMIFEQLTIISRARSRISVRSGPTAYRYFRFYNTLWEYYQNCIDDSLDMMQKVMFSEKEINIRRENDSILSDLSRSLLLDSEEFASALHQVTTNNYKNLNSLANMIRMLATIPEYKIDLRSFEDFL